MLPKVVIENRWYIIIILELYILKVVDGTLVLLGLVEAETILLDIVVNNDYYKYIMFDVINTRRH